MSGVISAISAQTGILSSIASATAQTASNTGAMNATLGQILSRLGAMGGLSGATAATAGGAASTAAQAAGNTSASLARTRWAAAQARAAAAAAGTTGSGTINQGTTVPQPIYPGSPAVGGFGARGTAGGVGVGLGGGTGRTGGGGRPPPGGSGGGGGGFWGSGGGNARGAALAASHLGRYAGLSGFGGLIRMGMTGPVGLAAAVGTGVVLGPELLQGGANAIFGKSDDYRRGMTGSYDLGRAGGFSGSDLADRLGIGINGNARATPWMQRTGTSALDALRNLRSYGISPGSSAEAERNAAALAGLKMNQGFAGMDQDSVISYARMRAGLNLGTDPDRRVIDVDSSDEQNNGSQVNDVTHGLASIMQGAIARGMDQARVLRNIEQGIDAQTRVAGSFSADAQQRYTARMMSGDSAASRSGVLAADYQGAQNTFFGDRSSPVKSMMNMRAVQMFDDDTLKKLDPDAYQRMMDDPAQRKLLEQHRAARLSAPWADTALPTILATLSPEARDKATDMMTSRLGLPKGPLGDMLRANLMNTSPLAYNQDRTPAGTFNDNPAARQPRPWDNTPLPSGKGFADTSGDSDATYRRQLLAMGVPTQQVEMLIESGKKYNIDPVAAGAVLMKESGGVGRDGPTITDRSSSHYGDHARGVMQLMSKEWKDMGGGDPNDPATNIDHGVRLLAQKRDAEGSLGAGMHAYEGNGPGNHSDPVLAGYLRRAGVDNSNFEILRKTADNAAGNMGVSGDAFNKLSGLGDTMSNVALSFANSTATFSQGIDRLMNWMNGGFRSPSGPHGGGYDQLPAAQAR